MVDDCHATLQRLSDEHADRHRRFQDNYRQRTQELLVCLLPDLEASSLSKLSQAGFSFVDRLPLEMENDSRRSRQELAALSGSLSGESQPVDLSEELEKLQGHFDALQPFLKKCFAHPRFDDLLLEGYGTDKYPKRFWHLSYYLDRRAAREVEALCEGRPFADIRREAIQALEASNVLKQSIQSMRERKRTLVETEKRRRALQDRLENHRQVWLTSARRRLADQLEADHDAAFERLQTVCSDELFAWRLARELCREHWDLEVRFLKKARQALEQGLRGTCKELLGEYERLARALNRFDAPRGPGSTIDWKALLYGNADIES